MPHHSSSSSSSSSVTTARSAFTPHLTRNRLHLLVQVALGVSTGGLLMLGTQGAVAQTTGSACAATDRYYCFVSANGVDGKQPSTPDFDKSGHNGNAGSPGSDASITVYSSNAVPAMPYVSFGTTPGITVQSVGGSGSTGTNASNNDVAPLPNLSAGSGGLAGASGNVTLVIAHGAEVQVIGVSTAPGSGLTGQPAAIQAVSQGGNGGGGGVPTEGGIAGTAQSGGAAGNVSVTDLADPGQTDTQITGLTGAVIGYSTGILAQSIGGNGGSGTNHVTDYAKAGVDGANTNAPGGAVTVTTGTSIIGFSNLGLGGTASADAGAGIWAISAGGNGGRGGTGSDKTDGGSGGQGGNASDGGAVTVTVQSGSVSTQSGVSMTPAVWAQSLGGIGGNGGNGGDWASGGNSGNGGNGGTVTVTNNGALSTGGAPHSPGILAQSLGGAGPNGGKGGGFGAQGGEGASGGNGSTVTVRGTGSIGTGTTDSPGILAQSIGGGGGNGGDSNGWLAVGGSSGAGGNGGAVVVNVAQQITTSGNASAGVVAQSIGGGGGNGGNATGSGVGINLVIGGAGGNGGNALGVQAISAGDIVTSGQHSAGMELQAIGGGGGKGGAAFGKDTSLIFGAQESVGGSGGNGGTGGSVGFAPGASVTNSGRILTTGSDSFGIVGQSIGGGGGIGAASVATAKTYAPDDTPSLSLSVAVGGSGGSGGSASTVNIANSGLIATNGSGAIGMVAQSIGGGGGTGGDASATATAKGSDVNISASIALGGNGGGAGNGGAATASNSGMIVTTGESADAMLVQSIGGGGGSAGGGDAKAKSSGDGTNISGSLAIGGQGKSGGDAMQNVLATNSGAILTLGDGASALVAQAIGGGGGRGGGGAGTSNGTYSASVNIGGSGGNGGSTWAGTSASVTATNAANSSIVTFGADAPAVVAQSIGGGGGMAGKAASTLGGNKSTADGGNGNTSANSATVAALAAAFKAAGVTGQYTSTSALTSLANALLGNPASGFQSGLHDAGSDANGLDTLAGSEGNGGDDSDATSIKVKVSVGGAGGSGGSAGFVYANNNGTIGTTGAMSDGIVAQSIGGGGGKGGAASASTSGADVTAPVAVGGRGGAAGNGGPVNVTNGNGASLITVGALANGIVAQSIGGGGGMGGIAGSRNGVLKGVNVSGNGIAIGGEGVGDINPGQPTSGLVTVNNDAGATILTKSHNASGIIAQSIGGGGGIVKTFSTDAADNNGGGSNPNPNGGGAAHDISITFGGASKVASQGAAGGTTVTNDGTITTQGRNSFGVLAQSVGGGGGAVIGGNLNASAGNFFGTGQMVGDGGAVQVTTSGGIATQGQGAIAILAQSIGGGGGLAGDTGWTAQLLNFNSGWNHPGDGNGGPVTVNVQTGAVVQTSAGTNTPAIWAQSIGGGGGRFTTQAGAYVGAAGGKGNGGAVSVNVGGRVSATGGASPGIYAESSGQGGAGTAGSVVNVTVAAGGTVSGGYDFNKGDGSGAGIQIVNGATNPNLTNSNTVTNSGTITSVQGVAGTAVTSTNGFTYVHNLSGGTIDGNILLKMGSGSGTVVNDPGGTLNPGTQVSAALLQNNGTMELGGKGGPMVRTSVDGDVQQGATGKLVIDTDHLAGTSDHLTVNGDATLGGTVTLRPTRLTHATLNIVDATGSLEFSQLKADNPYAFSYLLTPGADARSINVTPQANISAMAQLGQLSPGARSVAQHLQANFDSGSAALSPAFAALANIQDPLAFRSALDNLGNESLQAVGMARLAASHAFVERMNSCPTPTQDSGSMVLRERDCVWGRVIDNRATQRGAGQVDYAASAHTVQVGGQRSIGNGWFVGGAVSYDDNSLASATGTASVSGNGASMGLVVKREIDNWLISGAADLGYGSYNSVRNIAFGGMAAQASGSFDAQQFGLHSRIAYNIAQDNWYAKPYLDLHAVRLHTAGYTEQGAGALGLAVSGASITTLSASPMVEIGARVDLPNGMVARPYAAIGGMFHNRNEWGADASLIGSTPGVAPFQATSLGPKKLAKLNLGVNLSVSKAVELRFEYSGQFARSYRANQGTLRVNYLF